MWSLLHNPSAYPSAWTHTSSVVGSCFIYKLGMLTGQRFQAELSPSFLWKFTEFRAETPPHAFGIPNCVTPPRLRNSSPRNPPSPSEFQDAARGMVWIFSGITHCPHREILLRKVMFTSRSRVFIKNSCSKKERCNVTREVLKRFHIWVKNSNRLLSLRILRSKRRILWSPMPDENPEDVTLGSQC